MLRGSQSTLRGLKTLGEEAVACAPVGGDSGRIFLADLKASEIESRIVETRAGTRTCVTAIDQSRKEATELVQESERLRKTEIAGLKREFLRVLPGSKMAIFSGSLVPGVHANFYADCCAAARRNSVNVILDARGNEMLAPWNSVPWSLSRTDPNWPRRWDDRWTVPPACGGPCLACAIWGPSG